MGSVSDRFGRRPALLIGLAGFALSSVAAAMVDSSGALVALRFVMGTSAALIFPTTLSIISNAFTERRERAAALGLWGAAVGVGVAAGPVAGGWLLEHYSWPSVFWALVPVALITIGMTLAFVPESRDPAVPPLDKTGLVVSVAMLGLLTFTIIEAPDHGWLERAHPDRLRRQPGAAARLHRDRARRHEHPCSTSSSSPTAGSALRAGR